jgi:uncharacterized Zn finger protein
MQVEPFEKTVWDRVIGALARQAIYTAKLLAGELPADVVQLCDTAEAPLFPGHPNDIVMRCSCPDWAVPCKHVAAVHYALAAELDRDPFLLFRLRGRTREELTAALRARRGSFGSAGAAKQAAEAESAATADEQPGSTEPLPIEQFWTLGPELDTLHFEIRGPDVPGAVLRLLGRPPGWGGQDDLLASLHDLYRIASASVRDAALADVADTGEQGDDGDDMASAPESDDVSAEMASASGLSDELAEMATENGTVANSAADHGASVSADLAPEAAPEPSMEAAATDPGR